MPNNGPALIATPNYSANLISTNLGQFRGTAAQLAAICPNQIPIDGYPLVTTSDQGPMWWDGYAWQSCQGNTGPQGPMGLTGPQGNTGAQGIQGNTGSQGIAGVNAFGAPNSRSISLSTAYQATNISKPAVVTVNLSSTAALSLAVGGTNTANVLIGSTNAVATGTGTIVSTYTNSLTGLLVVGLAISTASIMPISLALPAGWYFSIIQTAGTVSITSAFDQQVG